MPGRGVLLRPEHRGHLEHTLKNPHHGLLVELGGLGQKRLAAEVVQSKDVGAALRPGMNDLRGVDLGEALALEILPKCPAQALLDLKHAALPQVAEHHGPQAQLGVQVNVQLGLGYRHRHGGRGTGEDLHGLSRQFYPAGGPGLVPERAGDHDRSLLRHAGHIHTLGAGTLQDTVPLTQLQESEPAAHRLSGVDHTGDLDGLVPMGTSQDVFEFQPLRFWGVFQEFHDRSRPFIKLNCTPLRLFSVFPEGIFFPKYPKMNKKSPEAAFCSFGTEQSAVPPKRCRLTLEPASWLP